jgi:nucleoside-diphosphate-sugar epimerase
MPRELFITGASGFLGRHLIKAMLAESDDTLRLLVRSDSAERLLKHELEGDDARRVRFVRGDITQPNCGIGDEPLRGISRHIDQVWHLAASTTFDDNQREEIEKANLGGTAEVIALAKRFDRLDRLYYMSTAYVCGKQNGRIAEDQIEDLAGFKNAYEKTKWQCERIVRASGLPFTIIRPSILIGDSRTGESKGEMRMMYGYLLALYHAARHFFGAGADFRQYWHGAGAGRRADVNARLYGTGEVTKNIVTMDDAVRVCLAIWAAGGATRNQTFNVVNSRNLPISFIVDSMQRALRLSGFAYDASLPATGLVTDNKVERAAYRRTRPFFPYARHTEPRWDSNHRPVMDIPRVTMTEELFDFLMERFVEDHIVSDRR